MPFLGAILVVAAGCNAISGIGSFDFAGAGGAGLGGATSTATASSGESTSGSSGGGGGEACAKPVIAPTAASLIALKTKGHQVANGYTNDYDQTAADIAVLQVGEAYLWEAGMSIDCDGMSGAPCSDRMPAPDPNTSLHASTGESLDAVNLPYVVLPASGCGLFDFDAHGVQPGSIVVVVNEANSAVAYAVFGDEGDCHNLGGGSYGLAKLLGIDSDPSTGGAPDQVLYIVFKGPCATLAEPENHQDAVDRGRALAAALVAAEL